MMTLSEYRDTLAWQGAIDLGPHIVKLAEELPEAEQTGLAQQLRQLMVELPGVIAMDLVDDGNVRLHVAVRLAAALELVERIYPALDTAAAREALDTLTMRLASDGFTEKVTTNLPNEGEVQGAPVAVPAPTAVPVEAGAVTHLEEATAVHVQPDSGQ
jgi:hypothetical protein